MAKVSPVKDLIDKFSKDHEALARKVVNLIDKYIKLGERPSKAVENAIKELRYFSNIEVIIEQNLLRAAAIGYGSNVIKESEFLKVFGIRKALRESAIDKVIKDEILSQIRNSKTYLEIANELVGKRNIVKDLPKYLEKIIPATKRGFKGKSKKRLLEAISNIENLAQNGAPNRRLKNSYSNLVRAVQSEDGIRIKKAIDRAMFEKARYRAERIARTEIARAQGLAHDLKVSEDEDVIGVKYSLSTRHKIYDICDFHTGSDLYGMGNGVYPKNLHPPYPFHPHCLCVPSEVFVGEAKIGSFDNSKAKSFINNQTSKEQNALLGIEGREKFKKSGEWQGKLRNWQGHEKPDFEGIDESFFLK